MPRIDANNVTVQIEGLGRDLDVNQAAEAMTNIIRTTGLTLNRPEAIEVAADHAPPVWSTSRKPVKKEKDHTPYKSKDGFVRVPILRGFTEIQSVWNEITGKGILCGGYVRYMCSPRKNPVPASDLDVYAPSKEAFEILYNTFGGKLRLHIKHENNMAITYGQVDDSEHPFFAAPDIQLIKPVVEGKVVAMGSMEEILSNFDFTVIRAGYNGGQECLVDADFLHDEENLILRIKNIHCPVSTTLRCMKYSAKGYFLLPTQALKLFADWDVRSQEYKEKLVQFLASANDGKGLSKKEVDELEVLMRID